MLDIGFHFSGHLEQCTPFDFKMVHPRVAPLASYDFCAVIYKHYCRARVFSEQMWGHLPSWEILLFTGLNMWSLL